MNYIDRYVIDIGQTLGMKIALAILSRERRSDVSSTTLWNRKSRLKNHYQDQILILSTQPSIYETK